jgi:hypothetical protein
MFARAIIAASLTLLAQHVLAVDVTENPDLIARLITANSQLDRLALLPDDAKDWHFDFTSKKNYNFAPGGVVNMNAATFPAAKGNRMTSECPSPHPFPLQEIWCGPDMLARRDARSILILRHLSNHRTLTTNTLSQVAMLNLGPCSILPAHLHARGTNYVVAVYGNTTTYMYEENGARLVTQVLTPGQATIFPQASMHMMMNTGEFSLILAVVLMQPFHLHLRLLNVTTSLKPKKLRPT